MQHHRALQCVDTLLDYVKQWDFNYSDIVALRNIRICVRKNVNES